ncbi:MAG: NapC/NirT family cytochrome c [Desulfovibrio sp.]|jgi:nitrate/TMAO reductase-like tetraheme cytochrome c subunit|nr:NapC/NirT family cytochrome c [Desulfovibrio sp.]
MKKINRTCVFISGMTAIAVCFLAAYGLRATSSTAFCLSCHEMRMYQQEQTVSSHAKDKDGGDIACARCHIPQDAGLRYFAVKIYSGVKDVAVHFWEQPQQLNRVRAQQTARRFMDDANCLACHADLYKNAKGEGSVSAIGKLAHDAYLGRNGQGKRFCSGCHTNLAHLPVFDRGMQINEAFASRLSQNAAGLLPDADPGSATGSAVFNEEEKR